MKSRILIVDDEDSIRSSLSILFKDEGYETDEASDGEEAINKIMEQNYELMVCDLKMPGIGGIDVLKKTLAIAPQTIVIIITAYATLNTAIEALQLGAFDYIIKPIDFDDILLRIEKLLKFRNLDLENRNLRLELQEKYKFHNIIGKSAQTLKVFELIKKVSNNKSNVLITGRSGTGKELVARTIHYNDLLTKGRFIPINCSAIADNLLESELFGYKKGAFTGAIKDKEGFFKAADGGTLFLDEIGEMPLTFQAKLLRAIESKEIIPVGSTVPYTTEARIISATNRNLLEDIKNGRFREDLYYRLNVIEIKLPSLDERKEDIPLLVRHFINKYNVEMQRSVKGVDNEVMRIILNYEWKGGIRELENIIERAIILLDSEIITKDMLPAEMTGESEVEEIPEDLKKAMKIYEKEHIKNVLDKTGNNKQSAAQLLGISSSSLYRKLEEYRLI